MTNSTAINYQALREIAKHATQGEWVAFISPGTGTYAVHTPGDKRCEDVIKWTGFDGQKNAENNARYIAAFNPEVVQALLNEREAQSKRIVELEASRAALAAENAGLKTICDDRRRFIMNGVQMGYIKVPTAETAPDLETIRIAISPQKPIPATDAFLAEIRAEARNEGINYTASRLAAAFNHGFINKSLREVFDVTRMILSAKEELANEPHPIDGLSGEYAEKSLEEWAEQIRKGGNQ
ncbi:TPA: ead/Ea22-like family protein [Escherichia coli]|uniref:ead/Ea22-like family protein n=1 Tax=Escherichia coli TaxID=562 RepID=UPI001ABD00D0|nr:ead/Ea22-like family protein [Escherichia coli]EDY9831364.1 ead/Ea22-like family protein [Salmonella enterica subsp. enterica serovar Montevideo]EDZ2502156.1 ead/Ea22-like family protein [Salmonella enterica subsp. enterica]HBE4722453.1 ead/Ea22-like family protein [Escherichia coli]HCO1897611.1 ead/Ea22-like family protein [Escherichia coli]HCO1902850.1 ead/Ea22-like family protein [Escherichia coli]